MTRCDADFRINLRFIGIRHTAVDQQRATCSATMREVWAQEQRVLYAQRQHKMGRSMRGWCAFVFLVRYRRMSWRCVSSGLVGARSVSVRAVSGSVIRSVLRLPNHITTNALFSSCSTSNKVERHKEETCLEQHIRATDHSGNVIEQQQAG